MVMTSDYRLVEQAVMLFVVSNITNDCPICGAALFCRSWRARTLIYSTEDKVTLMLRRLMCSGCDRIHHELPDCIVPYKRHCAETIEAVINRDLEKTPNEPTILYEERTAYRILSWWSVMLPYLLNILKSLSDKYKIRYSNSPAFKELVRAAVNSNNWTFADLICTRSVILSG